MCNSACTYLLLGATTREVAPDAAVAVHNSKLTLVRSRAAPRRSRCARLQAARHGEAPTASVSAFVVSMGISRELDDLIKHGQVRKPACPDARAELVSLRHRHGARCWKRPWTFETAARPYVRKIAAARQGDGASFRTMEWRLFCENKDRARLMFVRESDQGAGGLRTMMMMAGSDKSVAFGNYPARVGKYEVWSDVVAPDAMQAMLAASRLQMGESTLGAEGKTTLATFDIDTLGLGASWTQLLASCPANAPGLQRRRPVSTSALLRQFRRRRGSRKVRAMSASMRGHAVTCSCMKIALIYARREPLRSHRTDARQYRHRLLGAGAGGHAGRTVLRSRRHHPHRGAV